MGRSGALLVPGVMTMVGVVHEFYDAKALH